MTSSCASPGPSCSRWRSSTCSSPASWWLSLEITYGRDPLSDLRGDRRGLRRQPGAAEAPHFERAFAGRRDGLAGGALSAAGRRIHRRGAADRLRRRHHGAVCVRHHAAERRHGSARPSAACGCRYAGRAAARGAARLCRLSSSSTSLPPTEGVRFGAFQHGNALEIGMKLFTAYLLPFEVTSVLILIAIVGAIVLARKEVD